MYTEEPRRRIDWGYVFRKIIIIVLILLILFLLIWLINRGIQNHRLKKQYQNNTNIQENINNNRNDNTNNDDSNITNLDMYSESFITNYMYFHDNARDFVEKNNLPIENNSVKYTYQELIDKGILLPASYGKGTCDTRNSYVIVTNNDGKYTMTTTLICGKEIAKTNEELKCSELCGNCQKEDVCTDKDCNTKLEYEFKQAYKATETVYSCPKGYTKTGSGNSTKCIKNTSSTVSPSKVTTYSCPAGYTKTGEGSNTKCTAGTTSTVDAEKKTTYSCSAYGSDYKLVDKKCVKTTTDTKDAKKTTTYSCAAYGSDYKLDGTKCVRTITDSKDAKVSYTYTCKDGSTPNSNHMCPSTTTSYTCQNGDLVNSNYCRIYSTSSYYLSYNVFYGNTYNGCSYSGSSTTPCTTCPGSTRTVYNYYCKKTTYSDVPATPVNNTVYNIPAIVGTNYSCTAYGSDYKLDGTKCVKTTTDTKDAKQTVAYNCNAYGSDYELKDKKCVKTITDTKDAKATITYSCATGALNGKVCIISSSTQVNPTVNVSYNCPSGYTKHGLAADAICTIGNVETTNPSKSTKTVTKYKTKWSTETSLPGWTRTGKTRTVKAS